MAGRSFVVSHRVDTITIPGHPPRGWPPPSSDRDEIQLLVAERPDNTLCHAVLNVQVGLFAPKSDGGHLVVARREYAAGDLPSG